MYDTMLRVRISQDILEAYDLVRDNYDLTQSDLVRMAPLLLTLLVEKSFETKRGQVDEEIKKYESNLDEGQLEKLRNTLKALKLSFSPPEFTDYLRIFADNLKKKSTVNPNDIVAGKDGLPNYRIFPEKPNLRLAEEDCLKKVAEEVARKVPDNNKRNIPKNPTHTNPIPDEYWLDMLVKASDELGSKLNPNQMNILRKWFSKVVHNKDNTEWALTAAAKVVADYVREKGDKIYRDSYIPPEYDGVLLTQARSLLGRYLTATQKEEVRELLKKEFNRERN
ncbi:MAG: hypothetical protein OXF95_01070 [Rhodobacteraceae bacterium]|nr:hypothetical protein [Paracoccaceae bacterium]